MVSHNQGIGPPKGRAWGLAVEDTDAFRVLIVDASAHIRRLIATLLAAVPVAEVVEARNPDAAVPIMLARPPHLIIADFAGDAIDVLLFVHRIRRGELVDPATPVLALADSTHHAVLERAWEAGIDDVIAKPISAIEVIDRSAHLLGLARRRAAPLQNVG
jgi:PleD family two-component response regulator